MQRKVNILLIVFLHSDLKDDIAVQDHLKNLTKEELKHLFRILGLSTATVENRYEGTGVMAYRDYLVKKWILQDDEVQGKGGATWKSLQAALKDIGKTGIANAIIY